jgi:hypothetical protein
MKCQRGWAQPFPRTGSRLVGLFRIASALLAYKKSLVLAHGSRDFGGADLDSYVLPFHRIGLAGTDQKVWL